MNFFSFTLRLGNQHFVSKKYVNQNIFKNKVCIGCRHDLKQLLTPKKIMDHYRFFSRKLVWNGIFGVLNPKISFWGIFPTQFLLLSTNFNSLVKYDFKHGSFRNFRKVLLKETFFQEFCPKNNYFHSTVHVFHGYGADDEFWSFWNSRKYLKNRKIIPG